MAEENVVLAYIKQRGDGNLAIQMQKLMGVAITKTEEVEKYYWYVETEKEVVTTDIFWIATNRRVLKFYISNDLAKYETLLYYDQTGFIRQSFNKQRALLTNCYPITIKTEQGEVEFAPHRSYMSKADFHDFMKLVVNQLVNT